MRKILIVLAILALSSISVSALEVSQELERESGAQKLSEGISEEANELMGELDYHDFADPDSFWSRMQAVFSGALLHTKGFLGDALHAAGLLLAVCLLCCVCRQYAGHLPGRAVTAAGLLAMFAICLSQLGGAIREGSETISSLSVFSKLLLPVLSAVSISSGALHAGPVLYGVTVFFADLLFGCITGLFLPLLYAYLAVCFANCLLENGTLDSLCQFISFLVKAGLKVILSVFTGFLAVTQVIAGTSDSMASRAAKLTLSSVIPVVGSIISDATDTVMVSASMLKNSVGIYGVVALFAMVALPFLKIGIHYLALRATGAIAGVIAPPSLRAMLEAIAQTVGMLLAMLGAAALLLLISAVCSFKVVGA